MTDYNEMKATKVSRSDKLKSMAELASETVSSKSGTKSSSTKKSMGTKTSSTKKSTGTKSSSASKTATKSTSSRNSKSSTSASSKTSTSKTSASSRSKSTKSTSSASSNATNKVTKIVKKTAKKEVKKTFSLLGFGWILAVSLLIVGLVGGFFTTKYVCRNDVYRMVAYENGEDDIVIGENEDIKIYTEMGVRCVAFGKDYSSQYTVKYYFRDDLTEDEVLVDKVDETKEGIYYAVYSVPALKYNKTVKLIRNIIVTKGEPN